MHNNVYTAKTLIGNWQETRSTNEFEESVEVAKSFLPHPCYNKYIPISKDIGNKKEYAMVSFILLVTVCRRSTIPLARTG